MVVEKGEKKDTQGTAGLGNLAERMRPWSLAHPTLPGTGPAARPPLLRWCDAMRG